jgi:EmrB/QacA subfamily drug resistance transporter
MPPLQAWALNFFANAAFSKGQKARQGCARTTHKKRGVPILTAPQTPPVRLDHAAVRRIIVGLMLAMFLSALDQTIVATALATIGRAYGDVENLAWIVTAYLLAATAVTPLYGKLADIRGRRPVLLIGIAIFVVGSVACALSPTMSALIAARALQGLGGGGLIALSQTIIGDAVPPLERGRYQGYFGAVFALSSIAGPVLGGVFSEHLHWSLIFWINLPLGLIAFFVTGHALKRLPRHERPHQLDFLGAGLMVTATVSLLLALNWGGMRFAWNSFEILGLLGASALFGALFLWRIATAPEPFVPLSIMHNRVVAHAIGSAAFAYGTMIGLTIYTPIYFETVLGLSASAAGLMLIPFMGGTVIGSTFGGRLMANVTRYKRVALIGIPFALVALLPIAFAPAQLNLVAVGVLLFVVGAGIGPCFPITTVSIQNAVLPWQLGTATALVNFVRALASALLVALYGAFLFGGATAHGVTLETLAAAGSNLAGLEEHFRWIFSAAAACLALSWCFLVAMEERPLRAGAAPTVQPDAVPVPAE